MHCPMPSIFLNIYILVLVISNTSVLMSHNSMVNISYYSSTRLYKAVIDFQSLFEKLDLIEMPWLPLCVLTFPPRAGIGLWKNWIYFLPRSWLLRRGCIFSLSSESRFTFLKNCKRFTDSEKVKEHVCKGLTHWPLQETHGQVRFSELLYLPKGLVLYFVHVCSS